MPWEQDSRIRDLGQSRLTLRSDLIITPRFDGDEPGYLIEDRVNSRFFRVGVPEHTFVTLLDGKTSVDRALGITAQLEPEHAFTEEQAAAICQWLVENQLATSSSPVARRLTEPGVRDETAKRDPTRWNPWFLRIPLLHPDRFFARILPYLGWIFSWPVVATVASCAVAAFYQVLIQWERFAASAEGILAAERWIWLGILWLAIKVLHEMGHAIACKRFGGSVREAGVILILAAPVAYVDVSSSWRFRSKWQRIYTALAGMFVELAIASFTALWWSRSPDGVLGDLLCQVTLMASVTTVLFNANPLMRFDGYYILSDLLGIPNLYGQGQHVLRQAARKHLWGIATSSPAGSRRSFVAAYGVAAFVWRTLVCIGLAVAAAKMFHGAGIVLAVAGLAMWLGPPVLSTVKYFFVGDSLGPPRRLRFFLVGGGLLTALVLAVALLPCPGAYRAPCLVDYAPSAVVHAGVPGFVRQILVREGQVVTEGQTLLVLENKSLDLDATSLEMQAQQATARMRALLHDGQTAAYQAEREHLASLQERLREKRQETRDLTVRAPAAGRVVADDLESLNGEYLKRGDEILVIGCEHRKELKISIAQEDVDAFSADLHEPAWVRIHGVPRFAAHLASISPRARRQPPDRAFCAPVGGALPVRVVEVPRENSEVVTRYELLAPRFEGTLSITRRRSLRLMAGQRGMVTLQSSHRTIADYLLPRLEDWYHNIWSSP